jgi:outer membrane protein OmpA-like peptidoglycan-associated protein
MFRCGDPAPEAVPAAPDVVAAPPVAPDPEPPPAPQPPPAPEPPRVEVTAGAIELREKVAFEPGSATLLPASLALLDEVAATLAAHPEITRLRIEGHTDGAAGRALNQRLSERRAKAVRDYLIKQGVAARRLQARGYGEAKPIASNRTASGREQNRRVELRILQRKK